MSSTPLHPSSRDLTHVRPDGAARMVDVGGKPITSRSATAEGHVRISGELERAIRENALKKGRVLDVARLAAILAAKRTDELIPLCHTVPLDAVEVEVVLEPGRVRVSATARTQARTGVEMEALAAVTVACLTVIDMGKSIDKEMVIEGVRVTEKRGGRGGHYSAPGGPMP
ncbi:MAG: cyclic pyranopterin monophosphate synthase MoaC [Phycisphaerales bacterium]|nr:cyclic pyranopterin monophosphate synthase MoaC [Phycisphaerales bacterium]